MRVAIEEIAERVVEYSEEDWRRLERKRRLAVEIMRALAPLRVEVIVHGSVARGDVKDTSDVDVVVVNPVPPDLVELALARAGLPAVDRLIIQATPHNTPKVYFILDPMEERVVSVPLAELSEREREFYRFGGELGLPGLLEGRRVPGVNKQLILIIPTESGHAEIAVEGNESQVASILGVSLETVEERKYVLTRRQQHGRTGVFVKEQVPPGVSVSEVVGRLARENPHFRRALRGRL